MKGQPRAAVVVLLACFLAACKPGVPTPGSLQTAYDRIARSPACAVNLPMEWVASWPVPTGEDSGRQFSVMFYSLDRRVEDENGMPRVRVTVPRGKAVFTTEGKVPSCDVTPSEAKPLRGDRYPNAAMRLDEEEFDTAVAQFFRLTETVSGYYARKTSKPNAKVLHDYWASFTLLAEPALLPYYYQANPQFWEWLRQKNGRSISL